MDPMTAGIISGGAGLLGTTISNVMSSNEASKNRDFQERMSNSAHSREINDLRNAGLNPILSALGSGASTPTGATASINDIGPGISKGMDTAIAIKNMNKDFQLKDANIDGISASAANTRADTANKSAERDLMNAQINSAHYDAEMKAAQSKTIRETLPHMLKKAKAEGDYSEVNQIMGIIGAGTSAASDLIGTGTLLKGLLPKGSNNNIKLPTLEGFNPTFGKPLKKKGN